jgi:Zn-dependent protease
MKWSWKIGSFRGIGVYVHATFLLLIGWLAVAQWLENRSWAAVLSSTLFILALFAFVILHEFGHALTAQHYGIQTRDITLYPIGGVARLERMPDVPIQELWVALAGPAVNLVISVVLFAGLAATGSLAGLGQLSLTNGPILVRLMLTNALLAGFNLIPAFPMDGGRVLRALLALKLEYTRATQIAAGIGQGLAFVFGFVGLFYDPILLFIALFVFIGAGQETNMAQMKTALGGIPIGRAMLTDFQSLSPRDTLERAMQLILAGSQHDFPVIEDGRVVGILTRDDLIKGLSRFGQSVAVSSAMHPNPPEIDSYEMVEKAMTRLQESKVRMLPVTHAGQLVGLITADNISEFLMIRSALRAAGRSA